MSKELDLTSGIANPQLQVWWIPQVPMKPLEVLLSSFAEAKVLLESLAEYDLFQLENNVKPDYSNVGGLCVMEDGEWSTFYTESGEEIDDLSLEQCREMDRAGVVA